MDDDFDFDVGSGHGGGHGGGGNGASALTLGAGYALFRHGQDRQTQQLLEGLAGQQQEAPNVTVNVYTDESDQPGVAPVNALDYSKVDIPEWEDYIGQEPLKRQVSIRLQASQARGERFPHTLLASGFPGVGKTTMARLIARAMDAGIIELVPPFNIYTLVQAASQLGDGDVLFIDEIHALSNNGKKGAEILLKVLEDNVAFLPTGEVVEFADITIIGATTDKDLLPEPVIDRFRFKPHYQSYDEVELTTIAATFVSRHNCWDMVPVRGDLLWDLAAACRGTPRIVEEYVLTARDLHQVLGRYPTSQEVLELSEVEPDGMTRQHINYITAMRSYFAREVKGGGIEYVIGEPAIMQMLRETKQGIGRVERFLIERGLIDRTPRGRRLTARGIARAERFIADGKGMTDV